MSLRFQNADELEKFLKNSKITTKDTDKIKSSKKVQKKIDESKKSETILFNLLKPIYGDYLEGGTLVRELIPSPQRNFRIDVALCQFKIAIELDGCTGHAFLPDGTPNRAGFTRDREKNLFLSALGWHVITCTRKLVQKQPELILQAIEAAIKQRKPQTSITIDKQGVFYKVTSPTDKVLLQKAVNEHNTA